MVYSVKNNKPYELEISQKNIPDLYIKDGEPYITKYTVKDQFDFYGEPQKIGYDADRQEFIYTGTNDKGNDDTSSRGGDVIYHLPQRVS